MASKLRRIALIWFIVSAVTGIVSFFYTNKPQDKIQPISETNNPEPFYAVGFDQSGKLILLTRHRTDKPDETSAFTDNDGNIIKPASCYIDQKNLQSAKQQIDALIKRNFNPPSWGSVRIIDDNPSLKTQTVRLYIGMDDFDLWYIYSVSQKSIQPLEFGEFSFHDSLRSMVTGFAIFILLIIAGYTLLLLVYIIIYVRARLVRRNSKPGA